MRLINIMELTASYDNRVVIDRIRLEVFKGDYIAVVGENGSGKSTLIKSILGLKSHSGIVNFENGLTANSVGYLPQQNSISKHFPASVLEIVLSGCLNHKTPLPFYSRADKDRAFNAMQELQIESIAKESFRELSGGQQQRVLLARALCATEKLLVLDEPTSGLDPNITTELYSIISRLNKDKGIAVIMVSHDIASALKYASKILHISGCVKFFGSSEDYKSQSFFGKDV